LRPCAADRNKEEGKEGLEIKLLQHAARRGRGERETYTTDPYCRRFWHKKRKEQERKKEKNVATRDKISLCQKCHCQKLSQYFAVLC
jgi:hypothetical protein